MIIKKLQALKAKKGFTLVELIVVVAIIGVLAAILIPILMGYIRSSRISSANSNAGTIHSSIAAWISEIDSRGGAVPDVLDNNVTILSGGAWQTVTLGVTIPTGVVAFETHMENELGNMNGFAIVHSRAGTGTGSRGVFGVSWAQRAAPTATFPTAAGSSTWGGMHASIEGLDSGNIVTGTYPQHEL